MATFTTATRPRARRVSRRHLAAATAVVLSGLLASCSSGFDAQTDQIYQPGPGISVRQDGVYLLNAAIVTDGSGHGTLVGALLDQRSTPDSLLAVGVSRPGAGALTVTIVAGTVALPPARSVQLAFSGDVRVDGTLTPGDNYTLTMRFQHGAPITAVIPVITRSQVYKSVPIGPVPTTPTTS